MVEELGFEAREATEMSIAELAQVFNASFEGYLIPLRLTPETFAERVVVEAIDLASSFVILDRGPVGIVLIARRGERARVAGMGLIPRMRRRGAGTWAMERVIRQAKARGDRELMLEVFESNRVARALYERCGFVVERRLVGYRATLHPMVARIEELHPSELGRRMFEWGIEGMPWQVSREAALCWKPPVRCLTLERSVFAVITSVDETQVTLRGILSAPDRRHQGLARKLLRAICALYPGRCLHFPPVVPENASPQFFAHLGFEPLDLAQLEMLQVWPIS
jgi:GNAT superfamily N-acetyltransferase